MINYQVHNSKKEVIALVGSADVGKTTTIWLAFKRLVTFGGEVISFNLLLQGSPQFIKNGISVYEYITKDDHKEIRPYDFRAVVIFQGLIFVFYSQGDSGEAVKEAFAMATYFNADYLFCCSRYKSNSYSKIELGKHKEYHIREWHLYKEEGMSNFESFVATRILTAENLLDEIIL